MFHIGRTQVLRLYSCRGNEMGDAADLAQSPSHPRKDDAGVVALLAVNWCSGDVLQTFIIGCH